MELMFILKLLTPHWLGLGLCSCETPADSLSVFSLPFSPLPFFPLSYPIIVTSFLLFSAPCNFLLIMFDSLWCSTTCLQPHEQRGSRGGSISLVGPSRHWLNYPNNYLIDFHLWGTRATDFLTSPLTPPPRRISWNRHFLHKMDCHQVMCTTSVFAGKESLDFFSRLFFLVDNPSGVGQYVDFPTGHFQPAIIVYRFGHVHTAPLKRTLFWLN